MRGRWKFAVPASAAWSTHETGRNPSGTVRWHWRLGGNKAWVILSFFVVYTIKLLRSDACLFCLCYSGMDAVTVGSWIDSPAEQTFRRASLLQYYTWRGLTAEGGIEKQSFLLTGFPVVA